MTKDQCASNLAALWTQGIGQDATPIPTEVYDVIFNRYYELLVCLPDPWLENLFNKEVLQGFSSVKIIEEASPTKPKNVVLRCPQTRMKHV